MFACFMEFDVVVEGCGRRRIEGDGVGNTEARAFCAALLACHVDLYRTVHEMSGSFSAGDVSVRFARWED